MGDLPDAEVAPEDNVIFVCKLNPVTTDGDLELIFSRFGDVLSCEIIRDPKTGESLNYAFIEFTTAKQAEEAYFKMNNVLIDERRIKVRRPFVTHVAFFCCCALTRLECFVATG